MSRSARHPLGGRRRYLRPERDRVARRRPPRQPRLRPKRFSVSAALEPPDASASRPNVRLRVTGLVVAGLFILLALRLWTLQVVQAPAAVQAVAANQIRVVPINPVRGLILDRSGSALVNNVVTEEITLSRVAAAQHPSVIGNLAALTGQTTAQIKAALNDPQYSPYKPVPVLTDAPVADVVKVREYPQLYPGVTAVQATQRNYPQSELPGFPGGNSAGYPASQVLGYTGAITSSELAALKGKGYQAGDTIGKSGLEAQYEQYLRGAPGQKQLEVDATGNVVGTLKTIPAQPGNDLVTHIDLGLQKAVDQALAQTILKDRKTFDPFCIIPGHPNGCYPPATAGAAVVMDPNTGAVLAMSSWPSYNPSIWVGGISQAAYSGLTASGAENNWAIQGLYTPGSTFKLATATAALQSGLITPSYLFNDTGTYTAANCTGPHCTLHDNVGDGSPGWMTVVRAITISSDDFFYHLGDLFWSNRSTYGLYPIQTMANAYGLGVKTGIDLPGESVGRIDSLAVRQTLHAEAPAAFPYDTWYTGDNMELAFGQGGTIVTPIEMATAYGTFANGGTRYVPHIAAGIVSPTGKVIKTFAPQVAGHVTISPANYQAILQGFEGVVGNPQGTGYYSFGGAGFPLSTFQLAGKTGTSSTNGQEATSWFVAFGPQPHPQYVVDCVIDQGGYGASAAAPVVRQIYNYLLAHPVGPLQLAAPTPAQATAPTAGGASGTAPTASTTPSTTTTAAGQGKG